MPGGKLPSAASAFTAKFDTESLVGDVQALYESRDYAKALREVMAAADRVNTYFDQAAPWKLVKEGKFTAEDYGPYSMMKHKGSELAPLGTFEKKVPADLVAKVKAKEADIRAGKFTVKVDDGQPKSSGSAK